MKITFALLFTFFSHSTFSQGPGKGQVIENCRPDIKKLCSDKEHGQGEVRECLIKNKANVSKRCKKALETTGLKMGGKGKNRIN